MADRRPNFIIVGGGLGGALMAVHLAKAEHTVDVYEMRPDVRTGNVTGGRSINLAVSHRGIVALREAGLAEEVLAAAVPMRGRMIHSLHGELAFQPYGKDDSQCIYSVSRAGLNMTLLNAAQRFGQVRLFFEHRCVDVDLDRAEVEFAAGKSGERVRAAADVVIAADGAFSAVRGRLQRRDGFNFSQQYLEHGYKELTIPPKSGGGFHLEKQALHIWPRASFMMIALPNLDGSFTCTLFYPLQGPESFEQLRTEADVESFFKRTFPDAVPLMPRLLTEFFEHPTGHLATMRCFPWHVGDRFVLLGDAAHAVVPFYGQGMNASFEDVTELTARLADRSMDRRRAFEVYGVRRKPNTDALADLAIANFVEMRDHTGKRWFRWRKQMDKWLHRLLGQAYLPLYTMVTFTSIPYADARRRAKLQDRGLIAVAGMLAVLLVAAVAWLVAR